jgi:hypothetical protein
MKDGEAKQRDQIVGLIARNSRVSQFISTNDQKDKVISVALNGLEAKACGGVRHDGSFTHIGVSAQAFNNGIA